ncbi:hypothetical protein pb186bvf_011514 [Paramecium bursaria]
MSDDMPDLEDFEEVLGKKQSNQIDLGDYTKPKEANQPQPQPQQQQTKDGLNGLKKGFFNNSDKKQTQTQKQEQEQEIIKPKEKKNPLEIDEVQQNMNKQSPVGSFLEQNKDQWLNQELLMKIANNPKLSKLFTNPEYLQAVQAMQHNPKEVMKKFQNNKEFGELMEEYMRTMGEHFSNIKQEPKPKTEEERIQDIIQNDPEVRSCLQDQKVLAFIEYLQKNGKIDMQLIAQKDPQLMQKLQVLIHKGVLNIQRQ